METSNPSPGRSPNSSAQPVENRIVVQTSSAPVGPWGRVIIGLLSFALMIAILGNVNQWARYQSYFQDDLPIQEKFHSGDKEATSKIAIIEVEGGILKGDGYVKQQIDAVKQDKNVQAVVLRINSPGGTVTASDYLFHHLKQLQKERSIPLVVSMGSLCASGGYYVAMAVGDQPNGIYAEPTTWTGSIGVIIPHFDASGLLERFDVKDDSIASHRFKEMGSPTRKLNEEERAEERALLQALVDESFAGFKDVVRYGRPALREDDMKLDQVATGQVFTANQALTHGLIDKIGFIEDAIDRARELASLPKDKVRVVKYDRPPALVDALLGAETRLAPRGWTVTDLVDLTAPRAYYLSTWLPAVVSSSR
ncbi:MAG: signal peptide peptidase SppA [Planctomycetales bacterium]|nr:signal peptide peptidase SppA [Planctomycetales bacterium]